MTEHKNFVIGEIRCQFVTVQETVAPIHLKLDVTNYRIWSKVLEMYITGRKKKEYITKKKMAPPTSHPDYEKWKAKNALIKSWLINFMTPYLMSHFVQCETAQEVWDAVKRNYLDAFDSSQVYELMKKSFQLRQEGR